MSAATAETAATTEPSASAAAASETSTAAAASVSRVHGNPDDEKGCENSKANELEPHHDNLLIIALRARAVTLQRSPEDARHRPGARWSKVRILSKEGL
jgi:hypothetical protein